MSGDCFPPPAPAAVSPPAHKSTRLVRQNVCAFELSNYDCVSFTETNEAFTLPNYARVSSTETNEAVELPNYAYVISKETIEEVFSIFI